MEATHCQQVSVLLYNIIIFIYIIHIYVSYTTPNQKKLGQYGKRK